MFCSRDSNLLEVKGKSLSKMSVMRERVDLQQCAAFHGLMRQHSADHLVSAAPAPDAIPAPASRPPRTPGQ